MNSLNKDHSGDKFVLLLEDGALVETNAIQPCSEGFWISNPEQPANSFLLNGEKKIVLLQRIENNQLPVLNTLVREENRIALALLKLEQWAREYEAATGRPPQAVIFGSGSLALTILPNRVSHDIDIATTQSFVGFIHQRLGAEPLMDEFRNLDINPVSEEVAFEFMKGWSQRTARFLGAGEMIFSVLHPIDVLHQKLLRLSTEDFREKDQPDIARIMEIIRPDEETVIQIFKGGVQRYFDPEAETAKIRRANTEWFLSTYFPTLNLDADIVRAAQRVSRRESLEVHGKAPIRFKEWGELIQPEIPWPSLGRKDADEK